MEIESGSRLYTTSAVACYGNVLRLVTITTNLETHFMYVQNDSPSHRILGRSYTSKRSTPVSKALGTIPQG
jgi:hypothetical protein